MVTLEECDAMESKRAKSYNDSLSHKNLTQCGEFESGENECFDALKKLYPHPRDTGCFMEEKTHTYYVNDKRYKYSVSSVWKVFFPTFDAQSKAAGMIHKARTGGMVNRDSSLYNLYIYLLMGEKITPDSDIFGARIHEAFKRATTLYGASQWTPCDLESKSGLDQIWEAISKGYPKPAGRSCYFLAFCAGCDDASLQSVWEMNGYLESLKGTLLHKRAELYMQELAAWQLEIGRSHVSLGEMLQVPGLLDRVRKAASNEAAIKSVVLYVAADQWDHPAVQSYLSDLLLNPDTLEFQQFECWLRNNPELSPFRSEWSIYDEDSEVAGQIDSLWFDESAASCIVMADWKRARELLTPSLEVQKRQSFGEKGILKCKFAQMRGPCADLYNCSYSHYYIQQNLYADFLRRKYEIEANRLLLVQCHPNLGDSPQSYNAVALTIDPKLSRDVMAAFWAGWVHTLNK